MKITKDMNIIEVVQNYPDTTVVFMYAGLGCFNCMAAQYESIEEGAISHGIDPDKLVEALNEVIEADNNIEETENTWK